MLRPGIHSEAEPLACDIDLLAGSLDLAKAAKLLAEVAAADEDADADLDGLDLAAADEAFLVDAGRLVRSQAQVAMIHATIKAYKSIHNTPGADACLHDCMVVA